MKTRKLGRTNLQVTEIGFGGIPIQRVDQDKVNTIIKACYDSGINFIDTARGYTTSETMIGNALEVLFKGEQDGKFIMATKTMSRTYDTMKADVEKSLELLKIKHIDLYQCHFVKDVEQYEIIIGENGALAALKEAKAAGLIGSYGITAHSKAVIERVLEDDLFDTIQFPYNIVENQAEDIFKKAHDQNVGVIVMKPLAGGAIENAPLAIKYILNNPNVSVIIPGMDDEAQVLTNVKPALDEMTLTTEELKEIDAIKAEFGSNFCRRCGYCMPCPENIDIPLQFLLNGYLVRYNLEEWAVARYKGSAVTADACVQCGICEPRCPYDLPIRKMMLETKENFRKFL